MDLVSCRAVDHRTLQAPEKGGPVPQISPDTAPDQRLVDAYPTEA